MRERERAGEWDRDGGREQELLLARLEELRIRVAAVGRRVSEAVEAQRIYAGCVTVPAPVPAPVLAAQLRAIVHAIGAVAARERRAQDVPAGIRILAESERTCVDAGSHQRADVGAVSDPRHDEGVATPVPRRDPGRGPRRGRGWVRATNVAPSRPAP